MNELENETIMRVGKGTPTGELLRQYWIPALRSARVEPGRSPVRFRVLGQSFVAWRGADGALGIMDEACPHRGASMAQGIVEADCIRCIYHGWLFSADGHLLEAPTHPATARLDKLPSGARHCYEDGGMVWVWIGDGEPPARPQFAFSGLGDDGIVHATGIVRANWVQMLEGLWDTFHAQILHNRTNRQTFAGTQRLANYFSDKERPNSKMLYDFPDLSVESTEWGLRYQSSDEMKELNYAWIMPWYVHHTVSPDPMDDKAVQIHVPIDDDHTLFWQLMYNRNVPMKPDGFGRKTFGMFPDLNNFRSEYTPENKWLQDRAAQEAGETFTGIATGRGALTILMEDIAIAEGQGWLDRTDESLGATDIVVHRGRKALLDAVESFASGGPALGLAADVSDVEAVFNPKHVQPQQAPVTAG
ncbi:MAG: Rieske 2Fe-2S domain-containing protein [Actinomycetota bacterium]|nr:Rieske 2Fe-2S domain-containing protein [Actinomycetota bacterium]